MTNEPGRSPYVVTDAERYERDLTGYGRAGFTAQWPGGKNLALNIVVNYETGAEFNYADGDERNEGIAELPGFADKEHRDLHVESIYEYASRAGVFRLLRMFEDRDLKVTMFAAARALERNPDLCDWIKAAGHEPCSHGYRWNDEDPRLSRAEQFAQIVAAVESITATCGERPVGWQSRRPSVATRELLASEGGFLYDSNSLADDLPYYVQAAGRPFLVVPYSFVYNDAKFFFGGFASPSDFVDYCIRAIDVYLREGRAGQPKMMSIGVHGRWMGQAARASALEEVLDYALAQGDVWITRRRDIAEWWLAEYPPEASTAQ